MKKLFLTIAAVAICHSIGYAQGCLPEGITFTNQAQIDNFQTNYPGCILIEGDVWILGGEITNLNALSVLTSIGGNLSIGGYWSGCDELFTLTGLDNIASIVGNLTIDRNNNLVNLSGLNNLTFLGGDLTITLNGSLSTCDADWLCNYLASPNGAVNIYGNATGCRSIFEVAIACGDIPCLPYGNYYFHSQSDIDNFQVAFPDCAELQGDVIIRYGNDITDLSGLELVMSISGSLGISSTKALTSLTGLNSLTSIGGGLTISYNQALTSVAGLQNLSSIGNRLSFYSNGALTSLAGLNNLTFIGGDLSIEFNTALSSLTGLENISSIGRDLSIRSNTALTNLQGLDNLISIGNELSISSNSILSSLTGLNNLSSIGGNLSIFWNNALTSLTGLNNLSSIDGNLFIYGNNALTNLNGLDNLTEIAGHLRISENSSLSTCECDWLCDYLAAPNGSVSIFKNATGCRSVIEVAGVCGGVSCLPYGNYYFNAQSDIDDFQMAFPNCTELQGNVVINGNDITDLSGLDNITSIGRSLQINENALTSLAGLENLSSIGSYLSVSSNNALTNLLGLENILSIGGALRISHNQALASLTGLNNLTSIGDYFSLWENDALVNLTGLESLTYIGNNIYVEDNNLLNTLEGLENITSIAGQLYIRGNNNLINLTGLNNLTFIGENLYITGYSLSSLTGLENLTSIGGSLDIGNWYEGGLSVTSMMGMNNLTSIGGNLSIVGNSVLTCLAGLENLTSIGGSLSIGIKPPDPMSTRVSDLDVLNPQSGKLSTGKGYYVGNPLLINLTGLSNLNSIGGSFCILGNDSLSSLMGLDNLNSIGGNLEIISNNLLSTCEEYWLCEYLSSPNGMVNIYNNADGCNSVIDLANACGGVPCLPYGNYYFLSQSDIDNFNDAFPGCSDLQGDVVIGGDDITNLSGLQNISNIGGTLMIGDVNYYSGNPVLANLTGLDNLTSIGGSLLINDNNTLMSLTGLENLSSIGGYLKISNNTSLPSLAGVDNIAAGTITRLEFWYNTSLSTCEVQSVCDYLAAPNGQVWISNNAPGCNSPEEVEEACEALGIDNDHPPLNTQHSTLNIYIYPNPTRGIVDCRLSIVDCRRVRIGIFDLHGREVAVVLDKKLPAGEHVVRYDMTGLPAGVYVVELRAEGEGRRAGGVGHRAVGKVIKMD